MNNEPTQCCQKPETKVIESEPTRHYFVVRNNSGAIIYDTHDYESAVAQAIKYSEQTKIYSVINLERQVAFVTPPKNEPTTVHTHVLSNLDKV